MQCAVAGTKRRKKGSGKKDDRWLADNNGTCMPCNATRVRRVATVPVGNFFLPVFLFVTSFLIPESAALNIVHLAAACVCFLFTVSLVQMFRFLSFFPFLVLFREVEISTAQISITQHKGMSGEIARIGGGSTCP